MAQLLKGRVQQPRAESIPMEWPGQTLASPCLPCLHPLFPMRARERHLASTDLGSLIEQTMLSAQGTELPASNGLGEQTEPWDFTGIARAPAGCHGNTA